MEVRIKDNNGYVDADWTIEDGIMIVSPKVEKFEPKDGDVIHCTNSICNYVAIFRNISQCGTFFYRYAILIDSEELKININGCDYSGYSNPRPATEEEKKKLFDKLAEKGYEWDSEKKELLKLKWKPRVGERFYYPANQDHFFKTYHHAHSTQEFLELDKDIKRGWCFKTREECQEFCDRLNEVTP